MALFKRMSDIHKITLIIYMTMSVIGFIFMGMDKRRAKRKEWRIPESTLFLIAILGGGLGSTIGMFAFRHKTKHWYFRIFFPLFATIQILLLSVI